MCVCTPLTSYWPIPHLHPISRLSFEYLLHVSLLPELFFILRRKEEVWGRTGRSGGGLGGLALCPVMIDQYDPQKPTILSSAHLSIPASRIQSGMTRLQRLAARQESLKSVERRGHPGIQASWEFSKEPTWFFQVMSGLLALCVCAAGQPTSSRCSTL